METISERLINNMPRQIEKYVAYNLREIYHELGEYEFKIVLNPKLFKNSHESEMHLVDSDMKPMRYTVKKWGRKINCQFIIDGNVADGVSQISILLKDVNDDVTPVRLKFWVIK